MKVNMSAVKKVKLVNNLLQWLIKEYLALTHEAKTA